MTDERNKMTQNVPSDLSVVRFSSVRAQEIVALTKMIGEFPPPKKRVVLTFANMLFALRKSTMHQITFSKTAMSYAKKSNEP
jgi:hypothetical protein